MACCIICGEEFNRTHGLQKWCRECKNLYFGLPKYAALFLQNLRASGKPWLCETCGKDLSGIIGKSQGWIVHHKDGDHGNNSDGNHTLLCQKCHIIHHNAGNRRGAKPKSDRHKANMRIGAQKRWRNNIGIPHRNEFGVFSKQPSKE